MPWKLRQREIQSELFPEGFPESASPELTVLSFGAGQDSTAVLYLLGLDTEFRSIFAPNNLIVIFSDTGAEHQETYDQTLPAAKDFCEQHTIPFVWLEPGSPYHSKAWPSLTGYYRRTRTCGSRGFPRSCTDQLKIRPIYRHLEHYLATVYGTPNGRKKGFYAYANRFGKLRMLIGLSAEETGRCAEKSRPLWMRRCIDVRYPLQETGITRAKAQTIIRRLGFEVPAPSSCRCCPFLTLRDLLWKYRTRPDEYTEMLHFETVKRDRYTNLGSKNYGIFGALTLPEAVNKATALYGHLSDEQLLQARLIDGHAVTSKY